MGSTSSKETDANQADLGTNPNATGPTQQRYKMHHHPRYGGAGGREGAYGTARGPHGEPVDPVSAVDRLDAHGPERGAPDAYEGRDFRAEEDANDAQKELFAARASDAMDVDQPSPSHLSYLSTGLAASSPQLDGKSGSVGSDQEVAVKDEVVPMVFRWEHGGRNVYITGTFNGWSKQVPMHRSGNDFTYIANLTRGKHAYKFVVDEEWRFAPDQLTVADLEGNVNNFVDVSEFQPLSDFDMDKENDEQGDNMYGRFIPDIDEYTKEPPPLPPHLRHIILNKVPPSVDSRLLPVPQHVALNHLYCTAIKDGMMVLGITQRYKQKFVTTVYYSLMPGTN